jgi:LysM repeat protein
MSHRSPARFLAPLALLAAVLVVYLVARPELQGSAGSAKSTVTQAPATKTATSAKTKKPQQKKKQKTYTVKSGDVLGGISAQTGVSITDLQNYNNIDASQLSVGQKLKLTP